MPVELVEIDQVYEDQPSGKRIHRAERLFHSVGVGFGRFIVANSPPQEHIENLADREHFDAALLEAIEQHAFRRWNGVVVAIGRAREGSRRANKWTCDDAPHFVLAAQNLARSLADL